MALNFVALSLQVRKVYTALKLIQLKWLKRCIQLKTEKQNSSSNEMEESFFKRMVTLANETSWRLNNGV